MTDQEFQVIRAELERLSTGLSKAIDQIVEQQAEINAFQAILERKRVASPRELELARAQAVRELDEILHPRNDAGTETVTYHDPSKVVSMGQFQPRRCKARF